MTLGDQAAFAVTAAAAQQAAGVIAARHRGDFDGANQLLGLIPDDSKPAGFLFLADLAIALLAQTEQRGVDAVAAELSLHIATHAPETHS